MRKWEYILMTPGMVRIYFFLNQGFQIAPSDMGKNALPGMHGYTPKDKDSDAIWVSNFVPQKSPKRSKGYISLYA